MLLFDVIASRNNSLPRTAIPLAQPSEQHDVTPLAVTWLGHAATALVGIDGYRVLTDPGWSERCSPSRTIGPRRLHPAPVPIESLPALDAVVISHDHHDHLDMPSVRMLARTQRAASRSHRWVWEPICASGVFRRAGSSSWTGDLPTPSTISRSPARRRGTTQAGS
jgi:ribonuclease BN (tRNA processing enzyme)